MYTYQEVYQMKGERYILRQKVVEHARRHGIRAAAKAFGCSRNTVRKWIRRYKPGTPSSLSEQSRRPHHCPHKTPKRVEQQVLAARDLAGFGAERLKDEFGLSCSEGAIKRILRQRGRVLHRKKKHKTQKDLREVKRHWKLFGQLSTDTKYLRDIPNYWPFMVRLGLPRYQYTVRDVVSGIVFAGYADELSKTYSTLLAEYVSAHLAWNGVDLSAVEWQTDNGSEFLEDQGRRGLPSTVRDLGSDHHYIPVKAYTWQSDVETVHRLVEDEFFDRETFRSKADFWNRVTWYWYYFNISRPNRHKGKKPPLQIITERNPKLHPAIASWRALDLGLLFRQYVPRYTPKGGHDLPAYPSRLSRPRSARDGADHGRSIPFILAALAGLRRVGRVCDMDVSGIRSVRKETWLDLMRCMMRSRLVEERLIRLYHQGRMYGGVYTGIGQEAIGAATTLACGPRDLFAPCIRNLTVHLGRGQSLLNIFRQWLGRPKGPTFGRDGNVHHGNLKAGVYAMISHLGAMLPVLVGGVMARRRQGQDTVGIAYIGDGATSTGDFHEGVNFAAVFDVPVIVLIENNKYAYSTPNDRQYRCKRLVDKAAGYGIEGSTADGNDAVELHLATRRLVADLRAKPRPVLLECDTMRMRGHGEHDDSSYVPRELIAEYGKRDPIRLAWERLIADGVASREELEALQRTCRAEVDEACRQAVVEPPPDPATLGDGVYA